MGDEIQRAAEAALFYERKPSAFRPCPLSLVPCPLSLVPCPLSLVPCPLSLVPCPLSLLSVSPHRPHLLRDFQQRRIELDERVVYGALLGVTRVASLGRRQRLDALLHIASKIEIRPLARISRLVLHRRFDHPEIGLEVTSSIDGPLAGGRADLENKNRLVGPLTRFHEGAI